MDGLKKSPTDCPGGKVFDPVTSTCECRPGTVENPRTGRCVDEHGTVGRGITGKHTRGGKRARTEGPAAIEVMYPPPVPTPAKSPPRKVQVMMPRIEINPATFGVITTMYPIQVPTFNHIEGGHGNLIRAGEVIATRSTNFDQSWFLEQANYLGGLNTHDAMTVAAFTVRSSVWINMYHIEGFLPGPRELGYLLYDKLKAIHKNMVMPLFPQMRILRDQRFSSVFVDTLSEDAKRVARKFLETTNEAERYAAFAYLLPTGAFTPDALQFALDRYTKDFQRIIQGAPPVKQTMVVYRGVHGDVFAGKRGSVYSNPTFSSTAFSADYAMKYAGQRSNEGRLHRVLIKKGSHVLFIAPMNLWEDEGEYEIVLNKDAEFKLHQERERWVHYNASDPGRPTNTNVHKKMVTDVELL
jgi:hypothetical protein